MKRPSPRFHRSVALSATLVLCLGQAAHAAVYYWDPNGSGAAGFGTAGGTWGTDAFWNTDILGGAAGTISNATITTADDVNFGTSTGLAAGTVNGPATAQGFLSMTFGSGSGAVLLAGGIFDLAATSTITVNASASPTISGVLQGAGSNLIKTGTGGLSLIGTAGNTFSGQTTVNAGVLSLNKTVGVNAIAGNLLVTTNGTLSNGANDQIVDSATVTVDNPAAVWNLNAKTETIDTLSLSGAYVANKGFTTGVAGKLTVTNLTVAGGGVTLNSAGAGLQSTITAGTVTNTGGTWVFGTGGGTQSLVVGAGGLTIGGGSTINVNATATVLNFISLGGNVTSQASVNSNTISGAGSLRLNAARTFDVANGAAANDLTVSAIVADGAGAGSITKTGTGTMALSGVNTYTGGTTVSSGGLTFLNTNAKSTSSTHAFAAGTTLGLGVAASGTFFTATDIDNAFTGTMTGNLSNVTVTTTTNVGVDTTAGNFTYSSAIASSPTKGLVKSGANVLTLSGPSNTYTGVTSITGPSGGLVVTANDALGTTAGNTTIAPNTSLGINGGVNYSTAEGIVGSGLGSTAVVGAFAAVQRGFVQSVGTGTSTFSGAIEVNAAGISRIGTQTGSSLVLTGPITLSTGVSGVQMLFRSGDTNGDFVTLSNADNSWDTDTQIYSGNNNATQYAGVRLGIDDALPTTVGVIGSNASLAATTLDMNGFDQELNGLANGGAGAVLKITNLSAAPSLSTLTLNVTTPKSATATSIQDGPTGGAIALVKTGVGSQTLGNNNTYTGGTSLMDGTLVLGSNTALPANSPFNLSGGTLATGGFSTSTGQFNLAGNAVIDYGTGGAGNTLNFADASAAVWSGTLSIWNWQGAEGVLGTDRLNFTSAANLGSIDLANVNFYNGIDNTGLLGGGGAMWVGNDLVPVPEPGVLASLLALLGLGFLRRNRSACGR